jgi:hypothetical protein
MSKVMSMLEKYNLIEKSNKERPEFTNSNEENNIEISQLLNYKENIKEPQTNDYKEEVKTPELDIEEKPLVAATDKGYENKMLINEIYSLYDLENSDINTVFMLQNLINALPQNLPRDVVKQSVINIIDASKINLNKLLSDGDQRLEVLDKVMEGYYNQTNKRISEYKEEITKLSSLINNCKEQIKVKEAMLEEQVYLIKYEAQKISDIIGFFPK